jgi:tetratricopeptide (TPR) repeat protein
MLRLARSAAHLALISAALSASGAMLLVLPPPAFAQPQFEWPAKAKNLKVLPEDTPPEKLRSTMVGFSRALGVRCAYCHVGEEGKPLTTFDFPSDKNPKKSTARDMLKMLGDVTADLKKMDLPGTKRVAMSCFTCHRGRPRPTTLSEELSAKYDSAGVDSAIALYRTLKERFYGRGSYDFGEETLIEVGHGLSAQSRHADAIRFLRLNTEQFPQSSRAFDALGEEYAAAGQKDPAIEAYRKSLELDPKNKNAERKIQELQRSGK